jgi:hypothetical protein
MNESVLSTTRNGIDLRIARIRPDMGREAANDIYNELRLRASNVNRTFRIIFAPSQGSMLASLITQPGIDWSRITAFHMDEYIGLAKGCTAAIQPMVEARHFRPATLRSRASDRARRRYLFHRASRTRRASGGSAGYLACTRSDRSPSQWVSRLRSQRRFHDCGNGLLAYARVAFDGGTTFVPTVITGSMDRHANPLWPQLSDDRLTATFIADSHHLPSEVMRSMMYAKGFDKCVLVSDAVSLGGMPPGIYDTYIGGQVELSAAGRLNIASSELLAGATAPLLMCVQRPPGRSTGGRGRLNVGEQANIIRFHKSGSELVLMVRWLRSAHVTSM